MRIVSGRIRLLVAPFLVALTACGGFNASGDAAGQAAERPAYRVGDRWVYSASDGFFRTVATWQETHEVTAIAADAITVRITQSGPSRENSRTEQWSGPVLVRTGAMYDAETRRFDTPLQRYDFPLQSGKSWNQWVDQLNESTGKKGQVNRYVRAGSWDRVTTPAGTFDAIELHVVMTLDDEEFWRWPTHCNYVVLYAPAVRGAVRERKDAQYTEKGDRDTAVPVRTQHAALELVSFTPGPR